jgi:DNA polymerase III subunit gamma/tau
MSYLVLARKWRPQSFADLVGQDHVSQTLGNAIRTDRVHHAFLFTGARGVGKTSAARIFAKALNCESGITATPCNKCPSCEEITAGHGVDVFEIDGASNTGVDDIRELRENIRYLPSRSRFKIFIIDEVHMLSINAFNALLKTLEEPPSHAKFVFATTEPHKIPITILSRCQRFDFRKISLPMVVERLREIVTAEQIDISDQALALIARRGEGSMRDALSTLDQVIAFCGEQVADEDVQGLLGMVDRRLLLDVVAGIARRDSRLLLDTIRKVDHLGHSFRQFCQELVEIYRALIFCRLLDKPEDLLEITAEERAELSKLVEGVELDDLQLVMSSLVKTESELAVSSMPMLALEMAMIRLAQFPPVQNISTLLAKLESFEQKLGGTQLSRAAVPVFRPAPAEVPPPPEYPPVAAVPADDPPPKKAEAPAAPPSDDKGWPGLVEFVRARRRPAIASMLEHASLLTLDLPKLEIGLPRRSFALGQMEDRDNQETVTTLAAEYFAQPVTLTVKAVDPGGGEQLLPSIQQDRKVQESDRKRRLRDDALSHEAIKSAQEIFGGEIKEVRPIDKGFV